MQDLGGRGALDYRQRERVDGYHAAGTDSPLLKAKVHMKKEREQMSQGGIGNEVSIQITNDMMELDEYGEETTNIPTFHFTNDPNGLVYSNGTWHAL